LDEIDRSNANNILILNGILEGRGFYNPKTGEFIKAKEGFNIITTANSKGYGDESGKYLSQILDSAFLERFPITLEQEFPSEKVETKILKHHSDDPDFIEKLVKWARVIRKTYENGGIDEIISTRRLVHICEAYNIFGDKLKAINLCVSRFESHTKDAFVDLYTKIDSNALSLDSDGNFIDPQAVYNEYDEPAF
jgi:cobaltochelatase CobS